MRAPLSFLVAMAAIAMPLPFAAAQSGPVRVVVRPALPFRVTDWVCEHDRVVVKFAEGIRVRLVGGELQCLEGHDLSSVKATLGSARIARLFTRPAAVLDAERALLQAKVPANEPPLADLNNYFLAVTSGAAETEHLVNELNGELWIETAYPELIPIPLGGGGDIPPATGLFDAQQTHFDAAPFGLGVRGLESVVGVRFQNGQMAHLEGGWNLGHEDCCWLAAQQYVGIPPSGSWLQSYWTDHGTACVGLMAAGRNAYGVRGFGSDCQAYRLTSLANGSANMVNITAVLLQPGDVMSSSFAFGLTVGGATVHAPRDWPQADFDAVKNAATAGIHYTFGAGNTGWDLQNPTPFGSRYAATSLSSGGYIIGATDPGAAGRVSWSNYGQVHVIANAFGSSVTTLGYGDLFNPGDARQHYTATFGGTSAAGPQVAGVIAALVGAVAEQTGQVLTVAQVKSALQATGTAVTGDVGNRPDLAALLALYGLPDGLLVTQDGTVGGTFAYQVSGGTGELWLSMLATGRGNTSLGVNRPVLIDLTTAVPLGGGTLSASTQTMTVPVPNDPSLSGLDFYLQGALVRQGTVVLTSSAALAVL